MGLDMYLYLRKEEYESNLRTEKNKGWLYPEELRDLEEDIFVRNFASKTVETYYQVGYWRKANAIHNWFVEHCGDGVDECQEIRVSLSKLEELKTICETIVLDPSKAKELLPTTSGFFFGSTEYDEWYINNIKYTIKLLDKVIKFVKGTEETTYYYEVIYHASW